MRLDLKLGKNTDFFWARAKFDKDTVQYNETNKVKVEVFSKLA